MVVVDKVAHVGVVDEGAEAIAALTTPPMSNRPNMIRNLQADEAEDEDEAEEAMMAAILLVKMQQLLPFRMVRQKLKMELTQRCQTREPVNV